eukprot:gene1377-803_t
MYRDRLYEFVLHLCVPQREDSKEKEEGKCLSVNKQDARRYITGITRTNTSATHRHPYERHMYSVLLLLLPLSLATPPSMYSGCLIPNTQALAQRDLLRPQRTPLLLPLQQCEYPNDYPARINLIGGRVVFGLRTANNRFALHWGLGNPNRTLSLFRTTAEALHFEMAEPPYVTDKIIRSSLNNNKKKKTKTKKKEEEEERIYRYLLLHLALLSLSSFFSAHVGESSSAAPATSSTCAPNIYIYKLVGYQIREAFGTVEREIEPIGLPHYRYSSRSIADMASFLADAARDVYHLPQLRHIRVDGKTGNR